jgi:uncharacterized protein
MSAALPEKLDPWRAVQSGAAFVGEAALEALPRLATAVIGAVGPARYSLRFTRDEEGQALAVGRVSMTLRLTCQRCLEGFEVPVDAAIALALVRSAADPDGLGLAQVAGVPDHLDPMPLGDGPVRALDWVEDELLLALPQVPLHPPGCCKADTGLVRGDEAAVPPANPFAVLAGLRAPRPGPAADEH